MGDDDTVFVTDNLIRVLRKYDHGQMYYIGSLSESHLQNIFFSYGMAYGGGGFAISYPLAVALSKIQDRCIQRYPALYGSDDRIQACMAELGVPLTKEQGFHQVRIFQTRTLQLFLNGCLYWLIKTHKWVPYRDGKKIPTEIINWLILSLTEFWCFAWLKSITFSFRFLVSWVVPRVWFCILVNLIEPMDLINLFLRFVKEI